jgi:hypothetical protein
MPAIEHLLVVKSLDAERMATLIAERTERRECSAPYPLRALSRSRLCQRTNTGCPGCKKGN